MGSRYRFSGDGPLPATARISAGSWQARSDPAPMGRKSLCCAADRRGLAGKLARLESNALPLLFYRWADVRSRDRARNVDLLHAEVSLSGMDRSELQMRRARRPPVRSDDSSQNQSDRPHIRLIHNALR